MKEWRKPENPEKTLVTSFRKCHILKPEDPSPKRDSNAHNSIGGRLGKQTCQPLHHASHWWQARKADMPTVTPRVAPSIGDRLGKQTCQPFTPRVAPSIGGRLGKQTC